MGRRSSRPSAGRRPAAPRRAASTRAASPPAPRRAPARSSAAPPPQKATATTPPAPQQQQQPSMMGNMMANIASTAVGVTAGRALDRAIFGGGSSNNAAAPVEEEAVPPSYGDEYSLNSNAEEIPASVCAREALEFKKCMDRTASDVQACQWNLDILAACQQQERQTGFADAGRL